MMDLTKMVQARSDQLNAIDLITKPEVIKITGVKHGTEEQKLTISYEGDNGKPWKPCLTMIRLMIAIWDTNDGEKFVGKSVMLYRDPDIRFGRDETGGIRISHASGIDSQKKITLPIARGRFGTFVVDPLVEKPLNKMTQDEGDSYVKQITEAETFPALQKVAKALKEGRYENDAIKAIVTEKYTEAKTKLLKK